MCSDDIGAVWGSASVLTCENQPIVKSDATDSQNRFHECSWMMRDGSMLMDAYGAVSGGNQESKTGLMRVIQAVAC